MYHLKKIVSKNNTSKDTSYLLDYNISKNVKTRHKHSHKGNYGHGLLISGSYGKIGAAVLASKACLRAGVGLLTTYVAKCGYEIVQISIPEAMCLTDDNERYISKLPHLTPYSAIGIGPGIDKKEVTINVLKQLFTTVKTPLVIDADGLNILSEHPELLNKIPQNTIITPHVKEFERLVGTWKTPNECYKKQQQFAKTYNCIVVLKGANTCICDQKGNLFFNTSGNPGMATAGSGDVLTGIITALLAQSYTPIEAALIGVYFHGKAGDDAKALKNESSIIASDIIEALQIEKLKKLPTPTIRLARKP